MKILFGLMLFVSLGCDEYCNEERLYTIRVNYMDGSCDTIIKDGNECSSFRVGNKGVLRIGENGLARGVKSFSIIEIKKLNSK